MYRPHTASLSRPGADHEAGSATVTAAAAAARSGARTTAPGRAWGGRTSSTTVPPPCDEVPGDPDARVVRGVASAVTAAGADGHMPTSRRGARAGGSRRASRTGSPRACPPWPRTSPPGCAGLRSPRRSGWPPSCRPRTGEQLAQTILDAVDKAAAARWDAAVLRAAKLPGDVRPQKSAPDGAVVPELAAVGAAAGVASVAPTVGTAATLTSTTAELAWFTTRCGDLILTTAASCTDGRPRRSTSAGPGCWPS